MVLADTNSEIVKIVLIYLVPLSLSFAIYWICCGVFDAKKRLVLSVASFIVFLGIFSLVPESVLRISIIYLVPFGAAIMVYANAEKYETKKRLIISIASFIILLSILFVLFG